MVATEQLRAMEDAARRAAAHSYSPYSRFAVGAALLCETGAIYAGCNVESASLGLTLCAERAAVAAAVTAGEREFLALVLYTPTPQPTVPCGACRQLLREFAEDLTVIAVCDGEGRLQTSLAQLLPKAFGPDSLSRTGATR